MNKDPRNAALEAASLLEQEYQHICNQKLACAHCQLKEGIHFCGGPCTDGATRYCSQICANLDWTNHMCLIAGEPKKYKPGNYTLPGQSNVDLLFQLFGENEAFLSTLVNNVTREQLQHYLAAGRLSDIIKGNAVFWYHVWHKNYPFRLLIMHAHAEGSNSVTIERRRVDVNYEVDGRTALANDMHDIKFYCMSDLSESEYSPDNLADRVFPVRPTFDAIVAAYDQHVEPLAGQYYSYSVQWRTVQNTFFGSQSNVNAFDFTSLKLFRVRPFLTLGIIANCYGE
jgi:hypothetical protein